MTAVRSYFKMSYEELILMMPGKPFMKSLVFYFSNYGGFFKFVSNAIYERGCYAYVNRSFHIRYFR